MDDMYIDPEGHDCLTARQAAELTGRNVQTIYSWERRRMLRVRMTDDHGRKVYLLRDVVAIEHRLRGRARTTAAQRAA